MTLKLIKNFLFTLLILCTLSCQPQDNAQHNYSNGTIQLADGKSIRIKVVYKPDELSRGLSGVSPTEFKEDQGILFFFPQQGPRSFWMPDTYFDLDIIFLDNNLKVLDIVRDVPHHPGFAEPVPRVRTVYAWHVLEMKASSPLSSQIKVGQKLNWSPNWSKTSNYLLRLLRK
ncbi:MAG: DUF192 domain-containing protein [Bdellovibrionales bacterium]|jgi:uncharacterized membrane protein (UPF0127 family)|nr:DUF192 domain-containing protein [Bdellovibrionales bacterium]